MGTRIWGAPDARRWMTAALAAAFSIGFAEVARAQDKDKWETTDAPASEEAPRKRPAPAPQAQPAPAPYPGYGYPPGGYTGYPPPGYPPPGYPYPGYQYPPPGAAPPQRERELRYEEGDPVPPGYVVRERVRRGPIIAGSIVLGVPYVLGLITASATDFSNQSGWLTVPAVGPWITLASRRSCDSYANRSFDGSVDEDSCRAVRTVLVLDGIMQVTGAALFVWGVTSPKKVLVRQEAWSVTPARVGSGYGLVTQGTF
jgi:hypothetical protein